ADRPAPRRRHGSLHLQRRQPPRREPGARLARAAFPGTMTEAVVLAPAQLAALVRDIFAKHGMSDAHATLVADALVWAEMRGMDTHGVMRAPRYVELIRKGDLNARPSIKTIVETAATVVLDCDRAAGAVAMMEGVRAACGKANKAGDGR